MKLNRRIAAWAGGDGGKSGKTALLRPAGTANFKRHPAVDLVGGEITGVEAWPPEVLDQAIPNLAESHSYRPRTPADPYDGPGLELGGFLNGVEIVGEAADGLGTKLRIVCPWVEEHTGGDQSGTFVGQRDGGGLWFFCNHQHCQGRSWIQFRQEVALRAKVLALVSKGI